MIDVKVVCSVTFILLAALVGSNLYLWQKFYILLRSGYLDVWDKLGKPSLFKVRAIDDAVPMHRYIWRGEYKDLKDDEINRSAFLLRVVEVSAVVMFFSYLFAYILLRNGDT
jgi:hypothetical protein